MSIGISERDFWCMNPYRINIYLKGYTKKINNQLQYDNMICHLQGQYMIEALMTTVGNMFSGKSQNPFEYPSKPYEFNDNSKNSEQLSEEELQKQRERFVAQFMAMKSNFELNHAKKDDK